MSHSINVNSLIASVPRLNGANYHDWKFGMQMIMRRSGCWLVTSGKVSEPAEDAKDRLDWLAKSEDGLTIIGLSIDGSQTAHIRDCTTGPAAWQALADIHERNDRATRISLKRELYTFSHDIDKPARDYVTGITTIRAKLKAIGVEISDEDVTDILIYNLAPEYNAVATALMQSSTTPTVASITSALVDAEAKLQQVLPAHGLVARASRDRDPRPPPTCYRCQKTGHIARNCYAPTPVREDDAPVAHTACVATFAEPVLELF